MSGLEELLRRVETATRPSRVLDAYIRQWIAGEPLKASEPGPVWYFNHDRILWGDGSWSDEAATLHYTSSLDAAIALVEKRLPGIFWLVGKGKTRAAEPPFGCHLMFGTDEIIAEGEAATGPIAILIALLKAEISNRSASS